MERVLLIGATSAIANAVARLYAQRGARLVLCGRDLPKLAEMARDLAIRGANNVDILELDATKLDLHEILLEQAWKLSGGFETVLICHGSLPDQDACLRSTQVALGEFLTNGTSVISLSNIVARKLTSNGTLAVISSVAGDRGRASNFLYGSAKAAVTAYLSGLGQELRASNINVLTIKPGFVDTPMTRHLKKGILWAQPEAVAKLIVSAIDRRKPVIYAPRFWWGVMTIIKAIPEGVFRRIKL